MKLLTSMVRKLLSAILIGVVLLTTACNNGNLQGARPNNPPVQMGASNNPYKNGGDAYTDYKASTDPKLNSAVKAGSNRADSSSSNQRLAARGSDFRQADAKDNAEKLLYPGRETKGATAPAIPKAEREAVLNDANKIPAEAQPIVDRSDPNARILEKTGQAFKDASAFLKDKADEAGARPEMQANPGVRRNAS